MPTEILLHNGISLAIQNQSQKFCIWDRFSLILGESIKKKTLDNNINKNSEN